MVQTHDLTQLGYPSFPAKAKPGDVSVIARYITGAQLKANVPVTGTPATGDSYKIIKLAKNQIVSRVRLVVTKADANANTIAVGYTDGTNTSSTALLGATAVNSVAITQGTSQIMMGADGFVTITLSISTSIADATEFAIVVDIIDISLPGPATAVATVVAG